MQKSPLSRFCAKLLVYVLRFIFSALYVPLITVFGSVFFSSSASLFRTMWGDRKL